MKILLDLFYHKKEETTEFGMLTKKNFGAHLLVIMTNPLIIMIVPMKNC